MAPRRTILVLLVVAAFASGAGAAEFTISNMCPTMVYAAGVGMGMGLYPRTTMHFHQSESGRIWGRTGCTFDADDGTGSYETGDCAGEQVCTDSGKPPATLAEFALGGAVEYYDISVVDGFNVPMFFGCRDRGSPGILCMDPSCPEANHRPDDGKIHTCNANSSYNIAFCPLS